jgi:multiple antibiotic resistance protein
MVHDFLPIWSVFITSLVSLFVILDPLGNVFPYLVLTAERPPADTRKVAGRAGVYSFLILAVFALAGRFIIQGLKSACPLLAQ